MRWTFTFGGHPCTVTLVEQRRLYDGLSAACRFVADPQTRRYLPHPDDAFIVASGEQAKSWPELERILTGMLAADLTRDADLVGVGGGVVTDVAALSASLYMRGCGLVLVPTTLLAMVDAAVGGKTGINFGGYKNLIGTFYPAREVRICPQVLDTLPEREYRSGLAEVIKTALLGDEELLALLETEQARVLARDAQALSRMIGACIAVKGAIVEADLTESGVRAHLNLGHTFAHALEAVEGLGSWSHGEAVAWGIARAMELGVAAGVTVPHYARRVRDLLERYAYRVGPLPEAAESIQAAMSKDKKRRGSRIRFVLQEAACRTRVTEVDAAVVHAVLTGRVG